MKFTIEKAIILKAVADVIKAIPAKPVQPILTNILLELNDKGILRLTAADGELVALRCVVKPDKCADPGSTTVPAKVLGELVKTLPDGPVSFEQTDRNTFAITAGFSEAELPTTDAANYIGITVPGKEKAVRFEINSDKLSEAIGKTIYAVATEPIRPALTGLFFDLDKTVSCVVASDSHKLVMYSFETPDIEAPASFILPSKAAATLKGILQKDTPVKVCFDSNNARFSFGQNELTTRLIIAKYPKYKTIIPTDNTNILTVKRGQMLNALQRMAVLADRKALLTRMELNFNEMRLSAEDLNLAVRGSDKFECEYDGNPLAVGLKVPTLTDVLSGIDSEEVEIQLKDATKAIVVLASEKERKDEPVTAIVMPHTLGSK